MRSGMSKVVSLLTIAAALALSSHHVFAKSAGPGKAQTSGTSAAKGGNPAGGPSNVVPRDVVITPLVRARLLRLREPRAATIPAVPTGDREIPPFTRNQFSDRAILSNGVMIVGWV